MTVDLFKYIWYIVKGNSAFSLLYIGQASLWCLPFALFSPRWSAGVHRLNTGLLKGRMVGDINTYEVCRSKKYKSIATKLLKERDDLQKIRNSKVKVAYLSSQQEKKTGNGTRTVLGECIKVKDSYQWICPYDFFIVVYEQNTMGFTDEQYKILLWHELKHIGINDDAVEESYYVMPHDYEEFREIVELYGLDWSE